MNTDDLIPYEAAAALIGVSPKRLQGLVAKGLAVVHDFLPNIGRCVLQDYQRMNEFCA